VALSTTTADDGSFAFGSLVPGTYTVAETVPDGWIASTSTSSGPHVLESGDALQLGFVFGNYEPVDLSAHKFFDADGDGVQDPQEVSQEGIKICLSQDGVAVDQDAFGNPIDACGITDADGLVTWGDLLPGSYTVTEYPDDSPVVGLSPTTPVEVTVELESGDAPLVVEFGNNSVCSGLTPGYWKNWRNHDDAANIAAVDDIFDHWDARDPNDAEILSAMTLANQLTMRLTQNPDLDNPSGGSLYGGCLLPGMEGEGSLGQALATALDYLDRLGDTDPDNDPTDAEILAVKDVLDAFANQNGG
jgi:hypothetical protein